MIVTNSYENHTPLSNFWQVIFRSLIIVNVRSLVKRVFEISNEIPVSLQNTKSPASEEAGLHADAAFMALQSIQSA